ncbi:MAG: hypothetical protein IJ501_03715 [Bacilli bacterium]|nr:hypothetical protein [Bacilli bacterium]
MEINYNKIIEIYGKEYLSLINDNIEDVINNLSYLKELGFQDIEDIFERYTFIFICGNKEFKDKFNKLITKLGFDYVNIIENDLDILECLE